MVCLGPSEVNLGVGLSGACFGDCCIFQSINTQYMTNPNHCLPCQNGIWVKFSISGLKMVVISGLEKIFFHAGAIFY